MKTRADHRCVQTTNEAKPVSKWLISLIVHPISPLSSLQDSGSFKPIQTNSNPRNLFFPKLGQKSDPDLRLFASIAGSIRMDYCLDFAHI